LHARKQWRWNPSRISDTSLRSSLFSSQSEIRGFQREGHSRDIENLITSRDDLLDLDDTLYRSGNFLTHIDMEEQGDELSSKPLKSDLNLWFDEHTTGDGDFSVPENVLRQVCNQIVSGDLRISDSQKEEKLLCVILDGLAKCSSKRAAQLATDVLEFLENAYNNASAADELRPLKPTVFHYTAVMDAWARSKTGRNGAMRAEKIFDRMITGKIADPCVHTYTVLINAWGRSTKNGDGGHSAKMALKKFQSFRKVIDGLGDDNNAEEKYEMSEVPVNCVLIALAKSNHPKKISLGEDIFRQYFEEGDLAPTAQASNALLWMYAKSDKPNLKDVLRCEELFTMMCRRYELSGNFHDLPKIYTFNLVANAWAQLGIALSKIRSKKALLNEHFADLDKESISELPRELGDLSIFAANKCENLLRTLEKMYEQHKDDRLKPSDYTFNAIIRSWSGCAGTLAREGRGRLAAQRAEEILFWMERLGSEEGSSLKKPSAYTYTSVIDAWARSGEKDYGALKAESLLLRYESLNDGVQNAGVMDKPSIVTYNRVLSAWANMKNMTGMERSLELLCRMEKAQDKSDFEVSTPPPDGTSYNICMSAIYWSGVDDAPELCEELLDRALMRNATESPDGINGEASMELTLDSYITVMRVWARYGQENALISMEKIFERLLEQFSQHKRPPKIQRKVASCFNILIDTCASSLSVEKAGELLCRINTRFLDKKCWFAPPHASYHKLLDHWVSTCQDNEVTVRNAEEAHQILLEMHRMHEMGNQKLKPTPRSYSSVINVCSKVNASAEDKLKALQIAICSFDQYRNNFQSNTNHVLYGGFLDACINLSSGDTRTKLIRLIFRQCCKDGMLDKQFFFQMKTSLCAEKWEEIVVQTSSKYERSKIGWNDLPSEWSRNVK